MNRMWERPIIWCYTIVKISTQRLRRSLLILHIIHLPYYHHLPSPSFHPIFASFSGLRLQWQWLFSLLQFLSSSSTFDRIHVVMSNWSLLSKTDVKPNPRSSPPVNHIRERTERKVHQSHSPSTKTFVLSYKTRIVILGEVMKKERLWRAMNINWRKRWCPDVFEDVVDV
jgi:hypothetical protein